MSDTARARASRANARRSTGPRTPAGKAVVARNARRHGLSLPALLDPALAPEVEGLARKIAEAKGAADPRLYELACRIAEAQIDIVRVRQARLPLFPDLQTDPKALVQLVRLNRYERRAWSRRKLAIRAFADACVAGPADHGDFGRTKLDGKSE